MSYIKLKEKIKKGQLAPLYLLYGTEQYLIDEITQQLLSKALTDEERDFNLSVYDMQEQPVDSAVEEGQTLPFFGDRRVVIIKNASFLTGAKGKDKIEHNLKVLEEYIENPPGETLFIIIAPYAKLDERKKLVKKLKSGGEVLQADSFDDQLKAKWLQDKAEEMNLSLPSEAKEKLLQLAGRDLMQLASEFQKLALYAGESKSITVEAVEMLIARTLEENIFALVENVVYGRTEKALRIYYDLLKQNEEPVKILNLFARQFRIILHIKELSRRGYSRQKIAGHLKLHPYAVKMAEQQAKGFSEKELATILKELAEMDYQMKMGKMDKKLILELFITQLKKEPKKARPR
ncbi:DNA polymerase III subunit delta [Thalassorhabdus alkalitolerans]|uniref:DNA polymerase III subunit delta n=1 Tax=Thalassorhabdus alkalitolerans TaxID=2282697 RepID=A0ABW0YRV0_9BACI